MIETCPQCGRRLISHTLLTCGWCGAVIEDAQYQEQARRITAERLAAEEAENSSSDRHFDPLNPHFGAWSAPVPLAEPQFAPNANASDNSPSSSGAESADAIDTQSNEIEQRFGHLEI